MKGCRLRRWLLIRMISASGPAGGPTSTARTGGRNCLTGRRKRRKGPCFGARTWKWASCHAELDRIRFGQVRQALDKHTDLLRRDDYGGEVHPDDIRTGDQRRADALVELLTGRRAHTLEPLPDREGNPGTAPAQLDL